MPKPAPEPFAPVLSATTVAFVSFTVTSAAARKPMRRTAVAAPPPPAAGVHVALRL